MGSRNTNGDRIEQRKEIVRNTSGGIEVSQVDRDLAVKTISGFTPEKIDGLILWMDGADKSTFTLNENNTVSEWRDKSPNNFGPFTQDTIVTRPQYIEEKQNGKGGTYHLFSVPKNLNVDEALFTNYPVTIFSVTNSVSSTANQTFFFIGDKDTVAVDKIELFHAGVNGTAPNDPLGLSIAADSSSNNVFSNGRYTENQACIGLFKFESATRRQIGINGNTLATTTVSKVMQNYDRTSLGGRNSSTLGNVHIGWIHEIIVYNSILSDTQIDLVQKYLANKWGVNLNV